MKRSLKLVNYNVVLASLQEKRIPYEGNEEEGIVTFEGEEFRVNTVIGLVQILDLAYSKLIEADQKLNKKRQAELN